MDQKWCVLCENRGEDALGRPLGHPGPAANIVTPAGQRLGSSASICECPFSRDQLRPSALIRLWGFRVLGGLGVLGVQTVNQRDLKQPLGIGLVFPLSS